MPAKYLGFGHERLNTEKVSEKAKLFMRAKAKTSVDKNPSNTVLFPTEFGKLCVPLKKSWLRPWQLLDEVEHDSKNYQRGLCYLP